MWRRSSGSRFPCAMSANLPRHGLGVSRRRAVWTAVCVRLTARRAGAAGTRGVPDERDMPRTHWWPRVWFAVREPPTDQGIRSFDQLPRQRIVESPPSPRARVSRTVARTRAADGAWAWSVRTRSRRLCHRRHHAMPHAAAPRP